MIDPSQLLGPDGKPVKVDDLADNDVIGVHRATVDLIPTMIHGFSVHWKMGPYPLDAPDSHRKAVYVELWPQSTEAHALCDSKGRERIHSFSPLTPAGVEAIRAEPNGEIAELVVLDTLREAVRELRNYLPVPRQSFERKRRDG